MSVPRIASILAISLLAGCLSTPTDDDAGVPSTSDVPQSHALPSNLAWRDLPDATVPRAEHCAGNLGSKFYVMGGFVLPNSMSAPGEAGGVPTGPPVDLVEIYDAATNTWSRGPPYPTPLEHCLAATVDGTLYVVYEVIGAGTPSCNKIKDGQTSWTSFPCPANGHTSGVMEEIDGLLYATGGDSHVDVYDPKTDSWKTMQAEMPTDRGHTSGAAVGGKLYVVAGDVGGHSQNTDANEEYDPVKDNWTTKSPIPVKRGSIHAVSWMGRVVVMGGQDGRTNVNAYNDVNAYDPVTDLWTDLPKFTGRHGFAAGVWDDKIYVFGGAPQQGVSAFADTQVLEIGS